MSCKASSSWRESASSRWTSNSSVFPTPPRSDGRRGARSEIGFMRRLSALWLAAASQRAESRRMNPISDLAPRRPSDRGGVGKTDELDVHRLEADSRHEELALQDITFSYVVDGLAVGEDGDLPAGRAEAAQVLHVERRRLGRRRRWGRQGGELTLPLRLQ